MKIQINIPVTRVDGFEKVLRDLESGFWGSWCDVIVCALLDGAVEVGEEFHDFLQIKSTLPLQKISSNRRHGRERHWDFLNRFVWPQIRQIEPDYVIQLSDDIRLCSTFVATAWAEWDARFASSFVGYCLMRDNLRDGRPQWTGIQPTKTPTGAINTGWIDGLYFAKREMFEALDYHVEPINPRRWKENPAAGSGVYPQVSQRLVDKGYRLGVVPSSLVVHRQIPSIMNGPERARNPIRTIHFIEGQARCLELEAS